MLAVLGALLLAIVLTGCASPEPVAADEFTEIAKNLSFDIRERTLEESEYLAGGGVIGSVVAYRGTAIAIFDTCIDEESARIVFDFFSNGVEELFPSPRSERESHGSVRNYHSRRSSDAVAAAIRIDNTVVTVSAETAEDVAAVDALIAAIGY